MNSDKVSELYKNISPLMGDVTEEQFTQGIQNKDTRHALYGTLTELPGFDISEDEFDKGLGFDGGKTLMDSVGAHNPYPSFVQPNTIIETKETEINRPEDFEGEDSFYNLTDEELQQRVDSIEAERAEKRRKIEAEQRSRRRSSADMLAGIDNPMLLSAQDKIEQNSILHDDDTEEKLNRIRQEQAWRDRSNTLPKLRTELKSLAESVDNEDDDVVTRGTKHTINKALKLLDAPSKYGNESGLSNWATGLSDQLLDYDTWTAGITDLSRMINLKGIVDKMEKGSALTEKEQNALDAYVLLMAAEDARSKDLSSAYSIGVNSAQSIPFMVEMWLTAGAGAAAKRALVQVAERQVGKAFAERLARTLGGTFIRDAAGELVERGATRTLAGKVGKTIAYDVAQTAAMPTTYANIYRDMVNENLFGDHDYSLKDLARSFTTQTLETGTERWGGRLIDKGFASVIPAGFTKIWGKNKYFGHFMNHYIASPLGETGEEYIMALASGIRSHNPLYKNESPESVSNNDILKNEFDSMFTIQGFGETLLTMLPMSVFGGGANAMANKAYAKGVMDSYSDSRDAVKKMLMSGGASEQEAESIMMQIESSDSDKTFAEKIDMISAGLIGRHLEQYPNEPIEEADKYRDEVGKILGSYVKSAAQYNKEIGSLLEKYNNLSDEEKEKVNASLDKYIDDTLKELKPIMDARVEEETKSAEEGTVADNGYIRDMSGKKYTVNIDGKDRVVTFRSPAYKENADGTIDTSSSKGITLQLGNGQFVKDNDIPVYMTEINNIRKSEREAAVAAEEAARAEEERQKTAEYQAEQRQKELQEQLENQKAEILKSIPLKKNGELDNHNATPEQIVFYFVDLKSKEGSGVTDQMIEGVVTERIQELLDEAQKSTNAIDRWKIGQKIDQYYAAVQQWIGPESAEKVRENINSLQQPLQEPINNSNFAQNSNNDGADNSTTDGTVPGGAAPSTDGTNVGEQPQRRGDNVENRGSDDSQRRGGSKGYKRRSQAGLLSLHPDDVIDVERDANDAIHELLQRYGLSYSKHRVFQVTGKLFRQVISEEKKKNENGWMVSVHPLESDGDEVGYNDCKCFLTADGLSGIAVTPDGDIISLFSSVSGDHRMEKLLSWAITHGGKKADCFANGLEKLYARFGGKAISQTPFVEKWAPEDWDGESRGQVVFLIFPDVEEALQTYADYKKQGIKYPEVNLSEDVVKNFPDEDNGYRQAGEYRDKVLSGEITAESESPATEEPQAAPQESAGTNQPIDLRDGNILIVQGPSKQGWAVVRVTTDEEGKTNIESLASVASNNRKPTKVAGYNGVKKGDRGVWVPVDKESKTVYVANGKDADGNVIYTPYYILSNDEIKISPNGKIDTNMPSTEGRNAVRADAFSGVIEKPKGLYAKVADGEFVPLHDKIGDSTPQSVETILDTPVFENSLISVSLRQLFNNYQKHFAEGPKKDAIFTNLQEALFAATDAQTTEEKRDVTTQLIKGIRRALTSWRNYAQANYLDKLDDTQWAQLSKEDKAILRYMRFVMFAKDSDLPDQRSLLVIDTADKDVLGVKNFRNPLYQLLYAMHFAQKLGFVNDSFVINLPDVTVKSIVTRAIIRQKRKRYNDLKNNTGTPDYINFQDPEHEMSVIARFYPEVLQPESKDRNRLTVQEMDEIERKKEVIEERAKRSAERKRRKETSEQQITPAEASLETPPVDVPQSENSIDEAEVLDKQAELKEKVNGLVDKLREANEKNDDASVVRLLSEIQDVTKDAPEVWAAAIANINENSTPQHTDEPAPVIYEAAQEEVVEEPEAAQEVAPLEQAAEEAPAPEKRRKRAKKESPADQLRRMMEDVKELRRRMELGDREVTPDVIREKTDEINDFISDNGDTDELWNIYGAEFSISPYRIATTRLSRLIGGMLARQINRINGANVRVLRSKEEERRVLANLYGIPEFMSAYHGTDAAFDKFDLSFVGNGEGAQAYGFGVYVSRNKNIARGYAKRIANSKGAYGPLVLDGKNLTVQEFEELLKEEAGISAGSEVYNTLDDVLEAFTGREKSLADSVYKLMSNYEFWLSQRERDIKEYKSLEEKLLPLFEKEQLDAQDIKVLYDITNAIGPELLDSEEEWYKNSLAGNESVVMTDLHMAIVNSLRNFEELSNEDRISLKRYTDLYNAIRGNKIGLIRRGSAAQLYSVDIPDDTGENYLAWNERLTDEQLDKIYKAFNQFKYEIDGTPTGERIYDQLQAYIQRSRRNAHILLDGVPDNVLIGGKLYDEIYELLPEYKREQIRREIDGTLIRINSRDVSVSDAIKEEIVARRERAEYLRNSNLEPSSYGIYPETPELHDKIADWLEENSNRFSSTLNESFLGSDGRLDKLASKALASLGFKGIKVPINYLNSGGQNARSNEDYNYIIFNEDDINILGRESVEYLKTPNRTIYGFAVGNDIYLTQEGLNANTPIHEYTHLWVKALRADNPGLWSKIVKELKRNKALWDSVVNDPNYKDLKTDDAIASEVLARYSGKYGSKKLLELAKGQKFGSKKLEQAFINRVRRSLRSFWQWVAEKLFGWAGYKAKYGEESLDDFADMVLRDLFDGKLPNSLTEATQAEMEEIKKKAIEDGTFMKAPNGKQTKLTERQWLLVRTKGFKTWFGDWENDTENASKVLDENGEPLVVYHGSPNAGFDKFKYGHGYSNAIYTTGNKEVTKGYATANLSDDKLRGDAYIGDEAHSGIYSLFANIKNPLRVNFADEEGNPRAWNRYPSGKWTVDLTQYDLGVHTFDTEAEAYDYAYQFGIIPADNEIGPEYKTTDDFVDEARELGFDGCIFDNVYDGSRHLGEPMTDYVVLTSNQVKSVTNKGLFSLMDDRIEYQKLEAEVVRNDEQNEKYIREKSNRTDIKLADGMAAEPEKAKALGDYIAEYVASTVRKVGNSSYTWYVEGTDFAEPVFAIERAIAKYREIQAEMNPSESNEDYENYSVYAALVSLSTKQANQIEELGDKLINPFYKTLSAYLKEVIKNSAMYKEYRTERWVAKGETSPVELTPEQFFERYLIARENIGRARTGTDRGIAEFQLRMEVNILDFVKEFNDNFYRTEEQKKRLDEILAQIKSITDFTLDRYLECGRITQEDYDEMKAKEFYIPLQGFEETERKEDSGEIDESEAIAAHIGTRSKGKLGNLIKAEGGETMPGSVLSYMLFDAANSIQYAVMNNAKRAMMREIRENADWCIQHDIPVPEELVYAVVKDKDGEDKIVRVPFGKTPEEAAANKAAYRTTIRAIRAKNVELGIAKQTAESIELQLAAETEVDKRSALEEELAHANAAVESIQSTIDDLEQSLQFLPPEDAILAYKEREGKDPRYVSLYEDGMQYTLFFPKNLGAADALNGRHNPDWTFDWLKKITTYIATQQTVNNRKFWTNNLSRDFMRVFNLGYIKYGGEYLRMWLPNYNVALGEAAYYLATGKAGDSKTGILFRQFLESGANTGYSKVMGTKGFRTRLRETNPGLEGITWNSVGRGIDSVVSIVEIRKVANILNSVTELAGRFAVYKTVIDMGLGESQAVIDAHELPTNLTLHGSGNKLVNLFNAMTPFVNASIQGVVGVGRTIFIDYSNEKLARAAIVAFGWALLGYLFTRLFKDDKEKNFKPSEYERENYMVLGKNVRIALSEQIRPWWNIGQNIAAVQDGNKMPDDAFQSIIKVSLMNSIPAPQNVTEAFINIATDPNYNMGEFVQEIATPQVLEQFGQIARNENFMGTKLRNDTGDTPEYLQAPFESALIQDLAYWQYRLSGGMEGIASKHKEDGTKLGVTEDINPREIRTMLFFLPPSVIQDACLLYGLGKDVVMGNPFGTNLTRKEQPFLSRVFRPYDENTYVAGVIREARNIVKNNEEFSKGLDKNISAITIRRDAAKREMDNAEATGDTKAYKKWEKEYNKLSGYLTKARELKASVAGDIKVNALGNMIGAYDKMNTKKLSSAIGLSQKEFEKFFVKDDEELRAKQNELIHNMDYLTSIIEAERYFEDEAKAIEWFEENFPDKGDPKGLYTKVGTGE